MLWSRGFHSWVTGWVVAMNAIPAERQESQQALVGDLPQGWRLPYIFAAKASIQKDLQTLLEALGQPEKKQDRKLQQNPHHTFSTPYRSEVMGFVCSPQAPSVKTTSWS